MTGEHLQLQHRGVYRNWEQKRDRLGERRKRLRQHLTRYGTLAERLHEQGYSTAGITANPWTSRDTAFHRGFDEFYAAGDDPVIRRDDLFTTVFSRLSDSSVDWLLRWTDFYGVVERARRSLTEPYFLWVFLLDPHQPYFAPRQYRVENTALEMYYSNIRYNYNTNPFDRLSKHLHARLARAYRDACRSVDGFVRTLTTDLQDDDPVLVVHADHGEAFHEHGTYGHRPVLYEENIHVPFLIHNSGRQDRIEDQVTLRRLPEIVSSLADSSAAFEPQSVTDEFVISTTEEGERISIRNEEWKYIRDGESWCQTHKGNDSLRSEGEHSGQNAEDRNNEMYSMKYGQNERANLVRWYPETAESLNMLLRIHEGSQHERARIADISESVASRVEQ